MTFDEGGVGCCSRFCPVRHYNKDKPQKFRVDFFILSDASIYCILHFDVYQCKNDKNILVDPDLHCLATTQKAVMNAVSHWACVMRQGLMQGTLLLITDTSGLSWPSYSKFEQIFIQQGQCERTGKDGIQNL